MQKLFTKILVPVLFNKDTRWSVEKAVQLANKYDCDIYLLHVQEPPRSWIHILGMLFPRIATRQVTDLRSKMKALEQRVKYKMKDGLYATVATGRGYWQTGLKDMIISEQIDLVAIPKCRLKKRALTRRIDINKLSQETNCPVLTITRSFNVSQLHNIVVPVNNHLPLKKLSIATYMSRESPGRIFLMGKPDTPPYKKREGFLMRSYQLLNEFGSPGLQCAFSDKGDPVSATLAYAKNVHADLIVVNTGHESKLKGWWNKLRGKYLCLESDIPVLTVAL